MSSRRFPLLLAFAALLSGCGTTHLLTIDSLARENVPPTTSYRIQDKSSWSGSPQADAAGAYVKTALSGRGYYEAPPKVPPDLILEVDYGFGESRTVRRVVSEPVYDQGRQTVSGMESMGPMLQVRDKTIATTTYEKFLRLTARENLPSDAQRRPNEIWTIDALTVGESRDLPKYLPVLAAASIAYIGVDTHGHKKIRLKDSDADVLFVKKGM